MGNDFRDYNEAMKKDREKRKSLLEDSLSNLSKYHDFDIDYNRGEFTISKDGVYLFRIVDMPVHNMNEEYQTFPVRFKSNGKIFYYSEPKFVELISSSYERNKDKDWCKIN